MEGKRTLGATVNDVVLKLNLVETSTEWILMCESPSGGVVRRVPVPFTESELGTMLRDVETSIMRSYSKVVARRAVSPEKTALRFGERLVEVLLSEEPRMLFEECRRLAKERGSEMRVLLETDGDTVSQIPWEFAVDPRIRDDYLALRLSFARHLRIASPTPPLAVKPPLRVLGVHAQPSDRDRLDVEQERESVAALGSVSSDQVQVTWLEGDRWRDLSQALGQGGWHILHFIGHGGFDTETDSGFLELSDDDGAALQVGATRIGRAAARSGDLRLVVLNACESASTGGAGAFSSTAAKFMQEGIPAVVAMQYEITDPAALAFAAGFYESLARGNQVDHAVTEAREIVRVSQNSLEWATPVLFLASNESRLFDVTEAPAQPSTAWKDDLIHRLPETAPDQAPPPSSSVPQPRKPAPPPPEPSVPALDRLAAIGPLVPCRQMALGPGELVALACNDGSVRVWSLRRGRWASQCTLPRGIHPTLLAWSPWQRHIASAQDDGTVVVWDLEKEVALRVLRPAVPAVASLAFSASGEWLSVVGADRTVHLFDAKGVDRRQMQIPASMDAPTGWGLTSQRVGPCAFAPGDRHLVVASNNGPVVRLDVRGQITESWPHQQEVRGLAVTPERLVTCSIDARIRFWDWEGNLVSRQHAAGAEHVCFAPDGRSVVTASAERRLEHWSADGTDLATASLAGRPVGVGVGGGFIVSATEDGVLETWALRAPVAQGVGV